MTSGKTIRPIGSGNLTRAGIASKAARLDDAEIAGLPVPKSSVVPDGVDSNEAGRALAQHHRGAVAVRSAFAAEDRPDQSLAGHFDSFLNIASDAESLADAVDRVRASGTAEYRRDVLVMDMVDAKQAGVVFSEPGWLDDMVNYTDGLGDALLSGEEAGNRLSLSRRRRDEDDAPWQGRLAQLMSDVRDAFGDLPWDIEFADDGQQSWLLQIRPITSSPLRDEWFTLANHREILPDPPSVLMTSLIELASPNLSGPLGIIDGAAKGRPFIEVFDRRPYINLSLLTDFLRELGLPTSLVADSLGGSDGNSKPLDLAQLARSIPTLGRMGLRQLTAPRTARRVAAELAATPPLAGDRFEPIIDVAAKSYVALVDQMASLATAMAVPVAVVGQAGALDYHLRSQRTAATQMLDDMHELAALVRTTPAMADELAAGQVPADSGFRALWTTWLRNHGQRGQFESDLSRPRYVEDAASVLSTIARLAQADPIERTTTRSLAAVLTTPLWLFARGPMQAREALRADAMRAFAQHRADLLRCAAAAVERGALPDREDVWLLTTDELIGLDRGEVIDGSFIADRRADFDRCAAIDAPDLRRRFSAIDAGPTNGDELGGLPLTVGTIDGVAWVLTEPTGDRPPELDDLKPEQIVLVARSVDAGWVPLFGEVGAVAVDIGGDLSHGSIILRELGLPAITNTRNGTSVLQTGDRVSLDAKAGVLRRR